MRSLKRNRKGVSPVIATIIIVAIAIVMSIAVAYWMLGLGGSFTRYEKVEVTNAYAVVDTGDFVVNMRLKNSGSATSTLNAADILYNGKPASAYTGFEPDTDLDASTTLASAPEEQTMTLEPGDEVDATITLAGASGSNWKNGMTVEITLHSVAGNDYPKVINLP